MQKGNKSARDLHIALNSTNILLFLWQVPTGLEIVGKVFQFTKWPWVTSFASFQLHHIPFMSYKKWKYFNFFYFCVLEVAVTQCEVCVEGLKLKYDKMSCMPWFMIHDLRYKGCTRWGITAFIKTVKVCIQQTTSLRVYNGISWLWLVT